MLKKHWKKVLVALSWGMHLLTGAAQLHTLMPTAEPATLFVVAEDVQTQYVNGELRFCEREALRGNICGQMQRRFGIAGPKTFIARDWWRVETYVQARTGLNEFTLWDVQPTADGSGLVIYFSK